MKEHIVDYSQSSKQVVKKKKCLSCGLTLSESQFKEDSDRCNDCN